MAKQLDITSVERGARQRRHDQGAPRRSGPGGAVRLEPLLVDCPPRSCRVDRKRLTEEQFKRKKMSNRKHYGTTPFSVPSKTGLPTTATNSTKNSSTCAISSAVSNTYSNKTLNHPKPKTERRSSTWQRHIK